MTSLISIIIPFYNAQEFLNSCIESVTAQNYEDWELILVDDGSTDNSVSICNHYVNHDSRIRMFHNKVKGVQNARNLGLDHANGNFITFIDADDTIDPDSMEVCLQHFQKNPTIDVVQYQQYYIEIDGEKIRRPHSPYKPVFLNTPKEMISAILDDSIILTGMIWGKLYRSSIFKNYRFRRDLIFCEDSYSMPEIFNRINSILILPEGGYNYFVRATSVSRSDYTPKKCLDESRSKMSHLKCAINNNTEDCLINKCYEQAFEACVNAYFHFNSDSELISDFFYLKKNIPKGINKKCWKNRLLLLTSPLMVAKTIRAIVKLRYFLRKLKLHD